MSSSRFLCSPRHLPHSLTVLCSLRLDDVLPGPKVRGHWGRRGGAGKRIIAGEAEESDLVQLRRGTRPNDELMPSDLSISVPAIQPHYLGTTLE